MSIRKSVIDKIVSSEVNALMDLAISDPEEFYLWADKLIRPHYDKLSRVELMEIFANYLY